ncbi:MAG: hypothetical protein IKE17_15785, partial [Clostridia bacterium]|nr:hypothetical protein [Clostridia bacterium]
FFALVDRLPAAKKAPPAAYTPPRTIKDRGAAAPDTPGKLAKGEFVISSINQNILSVSVVLIIPHANLRRKGLGVDGGCRTMVNIKNYHKIC